MLSRFGVITLLLSTTVAFSQQQKLPASFQVGFGLVSAENLSAAAYSTVSVGVYAVQKYGLLEANLSFGRGFFSYGNQGKGNYIRMAALYGVRPAVEVANVFVLGGFGLEDHSYSSKYADNEPYDKLRLGLAYEAGFTLTPASSFGIGVKASGTISKYSSLGLFAFLQFGKVRN